MEIPRCLAYSLRIKGWATFLQIQQRLQRAGIADPKFYGINCRAKLGAKLLDRFFHRRRQVSPTLGWELIKFWALTIRS